MRILRVILPMLTALGALLLLAPAAAAEPAPTAAAAGPAPTASVRGIEYSATATEGRFGGIAEGDLSGAWTATVVHEPLTAGTAVPIAGGSFTLYRRRPVTGSFVGGSVAPLAAPTTCGNERFAVTGSLALSDGGSGAVSVVLTHLRARGRTACVTYGATVAGTLTVSRSPTVSSGSG